MPDDAADDFLSAALAAVDGKDDNAEIRQLLTGELTQAAREVPPETLREAASVLRSGRSPRVRRVAALMMVLTALGCMVLNAYPFYVYRRAVALLYANWTGNFSLLTSLIGPSEIPGIPHPSEHQRLLLQGREGATDKADRFDALANSDPGNASYYAAYIRVLAAGGYPMPSDLAKRVQETDPGNGELFLLAMGSASKGKVVEQDKTAATYRIRDQAAFDRAMDYFHLAAASPRFHSRLGEITVERRSALPPPSDFLTASAYGWFLAEDDSYLRINLQTGSILCAAAQKCSADRDSASFLKLSKEWRSISEKLCAEPSSMIDLLVFQGIQKQTATVFSKVATDLGLDDESLYYSRLKASLDRLKSEIKDEHKQAEATYSYISGNSLLPNSTGFLIPPSSPDEFVPDRLLTHAFFHRISTFILCGLVLILTAAAAAYRFRGTTASGRLAQVLGRLNARRTLPVAICASLTPLLLAQLYAWSPIGATRWNLFWGGLILMNLQALAALALALLLPVQVVRLAMRRSVFVRLSPRPEASTIWSGWIACACALGAWVLSTLIPGREGFEGLFSHDFQYLSGAGRASFTGLSAVYLWIACGLLAAAFLGLVFFAVRALLSSRTVLPRRLATARLVLPAWLAALCCLGLMQPALHGLETAYLKRNILDMPDHDNPAVSVREARVVEKTWLRVKSILEDAADF